MGKFRLHAKDFIRQMTINRTLSVFHRKVKLHRKVCLQPRETPLPSVSILKPLMGVDPNLAQNLETFFTLNYPVVGSMTEIFDADSTFHSSVFFFLQYELLFCIEDKDDPAIAIVNSLMEKYPLVDAHLFLGGSVVGVNPKINNMQPGYEAAKYEYIMISDSGIRSKFSLTGLRSSFSVRH